MLKSTIHIGIQPHVDLFMDYISKPPANRIEIADVDVLHLPLLGSLLRWRWGRLLPQLILVVIGVFVIFEGMFGSRLAAANPATILVWISYRGMVLLGILFVGNLFCAACPFTLPRTIAHRMSLMGRRWPMQLRNKWISIATLLLMFWLYEWLDLWANPTLTAWLALGYFAAAFLLEAVFNESPFCKYVCPLGAFNFVLSTASPLQITARDTQVCRNCVGKECIKGSQTTLGCGTELYVPTVRSNMDCTFCLDCARACPYDNVMLTTRRTFSELIQGYATRGWDHALLMVSLTFMGMMNAFGMVSPIASIQGWLSSTLGIRSEAGQLLILFGIGMLVLPILALVGGAWMNTRIHRAHRAKSLKRTAFRYAPSFLPLGFGIWFAHYGFHLAVGGLAVIPALQSTFLNYGLQWLGDTPRWDLSYLLPVAWIFPLQIIAILLGFLASLYVTARISLSSDGNPRYAFLEMFPWLILLLILTILALFMFNLPMEMRGTLMTER
jgi:polyferredoxin